MIHMTASASPGRPGARVTTLSYSGRRLYYTEDYRDQVHPRPTMSDVAAAAAVSLKTVSRVVNQDGYVSSETRAAVTAAIERLGFRRNEVARQLKQGSTAVIGLVMEDQSDPFYSMLSRAVEEIALQKGFLLLSGSSNEDPERSRRIIESFSSQGAAGIIVAPAQGTDPAFIRAETAAGCAIVFVDRPVAGLETDTVLADNTTGSAAGVAHLIAHGHRRIAFFADDASVFTARERLAGYTSALKAAGIPRDESLVLMSATTAPGLHRRIDAVLDRVDPPTAIMTGNNRWSVQLLRRLKARDEPAVRAFVGFDDFELSDVLDPGITVIAQDPAAMGSLAASMLFERIAGHAGEFQQIRLQPHLIVRGSGELAGPETAGRGVRRA